MFKYKRFVISAAAAAVLTIGAVTSAMFADTADAAKAPKYDVCHYQAEGELVDPDGIPDTGDEFVDPLGWRIINISGNALKAHVDKHTDGVGFDFVIDDSTLGDGNDSTNCTALSPFIA